jgi:hypothetical protein
MAVCPPLRRQDAREELVDGLSERTLIRNGDGRHVFPNERGGLFDQVEKTTKWKATCSVGNRNDIVEVREGV